MIIFLISITKRLNTWTNRTIKSHILQCTLGKIGSIDCEGADDVTPARTDSFNFPPLILREVSGWGKLYATFVGNGRRNDFWRSVRRRVVKDKHIQLVDGNEDLITYQNQTACGFAV